MPPSFPPSHLLMTSIFKTHQCCGALDLPFLTFFPSPSPPHHTPPALALFLTDWYRTGAGQLNCRLGGSCTNRAESSPDQTFSSMMLIKIIVYTTREWTRFVTTLQWRSCAAKWFPTRAGWYRKSSFSLFYFHKQRLKKCNLFYYINAFVLFHIGSLLIVLCRLITVWPVKHSGLLNGTVRWLAV